MADIRREDVQFLRSPPSQIHSFARFFNATEHPISVIWISSKGKGVIYRERLQPREFIDVNTYAGHKWVFIHQDTQERLVANNKYIWIAEPYTNHMVRETRQTRRIVVLIQIPVYSLQEICLSFIKRHPDLGQLLPKHLVEDLNSSFFKQLMPFERPSHSSRP